MDKLIGVPRSKKVEEVSLSRKIKKESKPLLDIEERRHNYDDRRSYTSYDEITKAFEDDFRCQDDVEDVNDDVCFAKPPAFSVTNVVTEDIRQKQMLEDRLLIGNDGCSGRQRKQPIRQEAAAVASIPHANAVELCATTRRDARSSAAATVTASRIGAADVRRIEETGTGTPDDDGSAVFRVKSSKTLQESIRESLTINNTAAWNSSQDKRIGNGASTTRSSSSSQALLD